MPGKKGAMTTASVDEHPRETSLDLLSKLPTPFRAGGTVTAGNSSGVNDGASALILASGPAARQFGLSPKARGRNPGTTIYDLATRQLAAVEHGLENGSGFRKDAVQADLLVGPK